MTDILGLAPLFCGSLLTICIMYTVKNPRLRDSQGKFLAFIIILLTIGLVIIASGCSGLIKNPFASHASLETHTSLFTQDSIILTALKTKHIYGIMFDAGSTGSRIHVFKFKDLGPDKPFEFVEELFEKVQPGLSAYAADPKKAAASLHPMLDMAKGFIPRNQWPTTPIALKATAGLRKLKAAEADSILKEVRQLFEDYPFRSEASSVVIMEGTDEGVYSWFTVNFYAGVLGDTGNMKGVMDLGGGSTQITFTPSSEDTIKSAPAEYLLNKSILGKEMKLYTHSYLDLGLMAGRLQVMGGKVAPEGGHSSSTLTSSCFPPNYNDKMSFGQDQYTVKGSNPGSGSRFDACYNAAKTVISSYNIHTTEEIQKKPFCIISYYYDRAVDAGIVEEEKGGYAKVTDFSEAAKKACLKPSDSKPYLCLDLCYLTALLRDGFKLSKDNTLEVRKKINGQEISWALGATFDFLSNNKHR